MSEIKVRQRGLKMALRAFLVVRAILLPSAALIVLICRRSDM